MSVLSDHQIDSLIRSGLLVVSPYVAEHFQPASIDLTLGHYVCVPGESDWRPQQWAAWLDLKPGQMVLGHTAETIGLPDDLAGMLSGRSSVGRRGIAVHVTAGWVDPGFRGQLTLEIYNCAPWTIRLRPGERIAQLALMQLASPCRKPYEGRYQGQTGAVPSRDKGRITNGG